MRKSDSHVLPLTQCVPDVNVSQFGVLSLRSEACELRNVNGVTQVGSSTNEGARDR